VVGITSYFQHLTPTQIDRFDKLESIYRHWNSQINVISRKDMDNFETHHVLHSLAIAKIVSFQAGSSVLDVGTGGGFPGIPLAILFPEVSFHLVDSIGKKIKVVNEVVTELGLLNVKTTHSRVEDITEKYDYILSRAVSRLEPFYTWIQNHFKNSDLDEAGLYALKGGDLGDEIAEFKESFPYNRVELHSLVTHFTEDFFETKKLIQVRGI
jgi:16S rRNA (guanine527-N7)-methyltransferase